MLLDDRRYCARSCLDYSQLKSLQASHDKLEKQHTSLQGRVANLQVNQSIYLYAFGKCRSEFVGAVDLNEFHVHSNFVLPTMTA